MTLSNTTTFTLTRVATSFCLVLALTLVQSVTATDAITYPLDCRPACADFLRVVDLCWVNRKCHVYYHVYDTMLRCAEPCVKLRDPCFSLCWANGQSIIDSCKEDCKVHGQVIEDPNCKADCFQSMFAEKRSSASLTLPSADVGPFEA